MIVTIGGSQTAEDGGNVITVVKNEKPQWVFVTNANDDVVMMARKVLAENQQLTIDARTTAIAMVAIHPLVAPIVEDYDQLEKLIEENPHFPALLVAVENSIEKMGNLFAQDNYSIAVALSELLDDLCEDPSDIIQTSRASMATRASSVNVNSYPMEVTMSGKNVTMRMTGLAPSYYGTVTTPSGETQNLSVRTATDYSGWQWIKKGIDWMKDREQEVNYGNPVTVSLSAIGNYKFSLSKNNIKGYGDFGLQIFINISNACGLPDWSNYAEAIKEQIGEYVGEVLLGKQEFSWEDCLEMTVSITSSILADNLSLQHEWKGDEFSKSIGNMFKKFATAFNYYDKISNGANAAGRIAWFFTAPEDINFCLSSYSSGIHSCSEAYIDVVGGNEQEGEANQALLLPLKVRVRMLDEQGQEIPNVYMKVKFKVVEGSGSVSTEMVGTDSEASVYWTLGEGEPGDIQKVEAFIVDVITGEQITEPVVFTAKLKKSSVITIRLNWHKLSGNTDIDLHVIDPFGYEIYFANSSSYRSGGWLDRDDVVGPGPEHIYFENAPAGDYQVKVHYYGSETRAVTTYRVTVTALGQTRTYSGSIAYHQLIPITTITIPSSPTRSEQLLFRQPIELPSWKEYPLKN